MVFIHVLMLLYKMVFVGLYKQTFMILEMKLQPPNLYLNNKMKDDTRYEIGLGVKI